MFFDRQAYYIFQTVYTVYTVWCTTRKPKGSSYTRSLTKLFEHSYRLFNKQYRHTNLFYPYNLEVEGFSKQNYLH